MDVGSHSLGGGEAAGAHRRRERLVRDRRRSRRAISSSFPPAAPAPTTTAASGRATTDTPTRSSRCARRPASVVWRSRPCTTISGTTTSRRRRRSSTYRDGGRPRGRRQRPRSARSSCSIALTGQAAARRRGARRCRRATCRARRRRRRSRSGVARRWCRSGSPRRTLGRQRPRRDAVPRTECVAAERRPLHAAERAGHDALPGNVGGVNWGGAAWDPVRDLLVANTNRVAAIVKLIPREDVRRDAHSDRDRNRVGRRIRAPARHAVRDVPRVARRPERAAVQRAALGRVVAFDRLQRNRWESPLGSMGDGGPPDHPVWAGRWPPPAASSSPQPRWNRTRAFDVETGKECGWRSSRERPSDADDIRVEGQAVRRDLPRADTAR